jgi:CelD/BcsL family acetyltransferase involved in cellulose biosynthesis
MSVPPPAAEPGPSPLPMTIDVVDTVEGLDGLRGAWDALFDAGGTSPFQSFEYQRTWWSVFGDALPGARLHLLVARAGERVMGIAPLFFEEVRTVASGRLRRLAFLGRGDSDYLDVLVAPGGDACIEAFARHLAGEVRAFDVLVLEDLTERSPTPRRLAAALADAGIPHSLFVNERCPRTPLADTWEGALASFEIDTRREIRRRERNLRKRFAVELEVVDRADDVAAGVDAFIAMHQERWNRAGHPGAFSDPHVAELHRRVAPLFFARGWLFLAFLRLDGRRAVANYCFRFRGELLVFLGGAVDLGDAWRLSPGRVMTGLCMARAIDEGLRTYDFMRGVEDYKHEFDAEDVPNWTILAYSPASRLARPRYRTALLRAALRRRVQRETFLWRTAAQAHGVFSRGMLRHVVARSRSFVADGVRKLRAPELNLRAPAASPGQEKRR